MKGWFYTVTQSMVELGLKGIELALYAVINGYSQQEDGCFYGTRATLAERCGSKSTRTIDAALHSLVDKGLINRFTIEIGGREYIAYSVIKEQVSKNCSPLSKNCSPTEQNLLTHRAEFAHIKKKDKVNVNTHVAPTVSDVANYCRERGWTDPKGFADYYISYQTEADWKNRKGKRIDNWKLNVCAWEPNHKYQTFSNTSAAPIMQKMTAEEYELMMKQ